MTAVGFAGLIAERVRASGKMTFFEVKAASLIFHDEAALMRRGCGEGRLGKAASQSGLMSIERRNAAMVNAGAIRITADFLSKVRTKKMVAKYPWLVCDDELKELRHEVRE
jgi:hypothetical protein